jgi:hypothetical protein
MGYLGEGAESPWRGQPLTQNPKDGVRCPANDATPVGPEFRCCGEGQVRAQLMGRA